MPSVHQIHELQTIFFTNGWKFKPQDMKVRSSPIGRELRVIGVFEPSGEISNEIKNILGIEEKFLSIPILTGELVIKTEPRFDF